RSGHSRPAVLAEAGADLSPNLLALKYLAAYRETFSSPASGQHVDSKIDAGPAWQPSLLCLRPSRPRFLISLIRADIPGSFCKFSFFAPHSAPSPSLIAPLAVIGGERLGPRLRPARFSFSFIPADIPVPLCHF